MESPSTFRLGHRKGYIVAPLETLTDPKPSVAFSPIIMHRRKDLWGPDGKCLCGYSRPPYSY